MGAAARKLAVELLDCSEVVLDGRFVFSRCTLMDRITRRAAGRAFRGVEAARKLNPDYN